MNAIRFPALRVVWILARQGEVGHLVLFLVAYAFAVANRSLMRLEDVLVPGLAQVSFERLVLILGHHRSGTTNLHKELRQHPDCVVGTMLDLLFPSLFLNRLMRSRPARWASSRLDRGVRWLWDTPNHAVGFDEEIEEHLWLLHLVRSDALYIMFPGLLRATGAERFAKELEVTDRDLVFVRRCLQRRLYALRREHPDATYVARPLLFTMDHAILRRHVPEAKILLCVREPAAAIRSHFALTQQQMRCAPHAPHLLLWGERFYEVASRRQYAAIRDLLADEDLKGRLLPLPFDRLKRDTPGALRSIVAFLGLRPVELPALRSERHGSSTAGATLIPPERIERDLGATWREIEALLSVR